VGLSNGIPVALESAAATAAALTVAPGGVPEGANGGADFPFERQPGVAGEAFYGC